MTQLLALEWDASEARLVVASSRAGRVVIEQAFAVTLGSRQPGEDRADVDVGGRIAAALAARGIGRIDTLVAVGRTHAELRQLSLPIAPDEELPELVRYQAMREFNELDDDWLLDFVPIDEAAEGARNVLAAAVRPELLAHIQGVCEAANLKPRRLVLRPCAAASLLVRSRAVGPTQLRLLVDLLTDEVDLTVMMDRKVIYTRATRPGGDPLGSPEQSKALLAEIRRTMAAAENRLGGQRVESIVLCGSGEPHAALAQTIEQRSGTPTELFDPFAGLNLGRELQRALPENPGRFAPLLGMALAELEQTGHAIDFLHPRRRAEPPIRYTKLMIAAAAAVALVLSLFTYRVLQRSWLSTQKKELAAKSKKLDEDVAQAQRATTAVKAIEKWTATDIVWLDELGELSEEFPPAKEAVLTQLSLDPSSSGGKMTLQGLAANATSIGKVEEKLGDERHLVEGAGTSDDDSRRFYSRRFTSLVFVKREQR